MDWREAARVIAVIVGYIIIGRRLTYLPARLPRLLSVQTGQTVSVCSGRESLCYQHCRDYLADHVLPDGCFLLHGLFSVGIP